MKRASGVLLHPTSLPGPFGIGELNDQAYKFVDFLADTGQKLWQVLPLGPTGYGDSPYQCFSAFAGNPLLISLEHLIRENALTQDDLADAPEFDDDAGRFWRSDRFQVCGAGTIGRAFYQLRRHRRPKSLQTVLRRQCAVAG